MGVVDRQASRHTDRHTDRQTDTHINAMTRPGLGAGPSEKHFRHILIEDKSPLRCKANKLYD